MNRKIAVVGLGYVGLPLAVAFGKQAKVVGLDVKQKRVQELQAGHDGTGEVSDADLKSADVEFTNDPAKLKTCDFILVAVPTPVDQANRPDLSPLLSASEMVGKNLSKGAIVVFESTVYPGATEEDCVPVLEKASGLSCGKDFFVGYSPERINPGDRTHTLENVIKIVSGMDEATLKIVASVYETVVKAGVYRAPNIKTAEAAKVIENTQRDINIALVNELSLMFRLMNLDTLEVLKAAGTKWNFLNFRPGLVGGHCIGVDPYYLTHKAEELGYHPQVILAGRRINDNMGRFVGQNVIKTLMTHKPGKNSYKVGVFGLSFKENVKDLRNSKVFDILGEIAEYGVEVIVNDPHFAESEVPLGKGMKYASLEGFPKCDAVVLAVAHEAYQKKGASYFQSILDKGGVMFDLKGIFEPATFKDFHYWRL